MIPHMFNYHSFLIVIVFIEDEHSSDRSGQFYLTADKRKGRGYSLSF